MNKRLVARELLLIAKNLIAEDKVRLGQGEQ